MDGSFAAQLVPYPVDHIFGTVGHAEVHHGDAAYRHRGFKSDTAFTGITITPADTVKRRIAEWDCLSGESIRATRNDVFEAEYCGRHHLLIAYEQAERRDGETIVEGLARSTRHDLSNKLTYVPPLRKFREWQAPRVPMRATYVYLDSALVDSDHQSATSHAARLFFESPVVWQTVRKLKALVETGLATSRLHAEALGVVLAHELLSLNSSPAVVDAPARGGLAGWQRKLVAQYVEDNLAEPISLAQLAGLAQLSPYHFSRAFKQSFGVPPHRYHTTRRIERARTLLADPRLSVTEIAAELGFNDTSSFSATFRKLARRTPTAYRRSLV
jgi:AraC family transcriptional regulator